jgi:hypothetical protein
MLLGVVKYSTKNNSLKVKLNNVTAKAKGLALLGV